MTFAKMPRAGSLCIKLISIFLIPTFILSNIAYASPTTDSTSAKSQNITVTNPESIIVPREFGLIKTKFTGKDDRLVIHIQDAHCNYEAQSNIVKILETLYKNYNVSLVSVEGADGVIDTSWFKAFPDDEVRKEVADYFMKKGEITGPEFISITTDYNIKLFGAETRSYYIDNLNAFTSSYPLKDDTEKYLNSIKSALNKLKTYIYSEDLRLMDAKYQDYDSKKLAFNDYVKFLQVEAEKAKINLRAYENFFKLVSVLIYEKKIDFTVTDKERSALIDNLSKAIAKEALTELVNKSLEFKTGKVSSADYYAYLKRLAIDNDTDLAKDYPNLYNYIIYNSVYSKIENEKLFNDIKKLEFDIKEKLFTNDDQRTLEKLSRHIDILIGLVNIKLLNGDYEYFESNKSEFSHEIFSDFLKKKAVQYGLAYDAEDPNDAVAKALPKLEDFYSIAVKRDKALVDNTLGQMKKEKLQVAVLVTGGFHSEGMAKLLEKQGVSYMVVCPSITKDLPTPYIQILTNQKTPLADILVTPVHASETTDLAEKEALAPPLRTFLNQMSNDALKKYLSGLDPDYAASLEVQVRRLDEEWLTALVNGIEIGRVRIGGYFSKIRGGNIDEISSVTSTAVDDLLKRWEVRCRKLRMDKAAISSIMQSVRKQLPEPVMEQMRKEYERVQAQKGRIVASSKNPGTLSNQAADGAVLNNDESAEFNDVLRSFFADKAARLKDGRTRIIPVKVTRDGVTVTVNMVAHDGMIDALAAKRLPANIHPSRGGEKFQHDLVQAQLDSYFYDRLTEEEIQTIASHELVHINIHNGIEFPDKINSATGKPNKENPDYLAYLKSKAAALTEAGRRGLQLDLGKFEEWFVNTLPGCNTADIAGKLRELLRIRQEAKKALDRIRGRDIVGAAEGTIGIDNMKAVIAMDSTLRKGSSDVKRVFEDISKDSVWGKTEQGILAKDYLAHRAQLDAISEIREIPTRDGAGYGAYIFVSSTQVNADYWQKRFEEGRGSVLPKDAVIISISEHNWKGGAGNGFGTLNGWKQAVKKFAVQRKISEREADKLLMAICRNMGIVMMHMAGKATRMQTVAMDNKSAVKLPGTVTIDGKKENLTVGEAVIMNFGLNVRPGRLTLAWGDQNNIPSTNIDSPDTHLAEIFGVSVPMKGNETFLPQKGLLAPAGTARDTDILQREKLPIDDIIRRANGKDYAVMSLGFNSFRAELLEAALQEFSSELANEGKPTGLMTSLNIDSEFWGPFTSTEDEYAAFMKGKGPKGMSDADWEAYVRKYWARVRGIFKAAETEANQSRPAGTPRIVAFDEKSGRGVMQGITYGEMGNTSEWWDWGMMNEYFNGLMLLLAPIKSYKDEWRVDRIRRFFGLPKRDQWAASSKTGETTVDNSVVIGSNIKKGRIVNSIVIGVTAEELNVENAIVIGSTVYKLTAKGHNVVTDLVSNAGEEVVLGKDEILACHYLPDVGQIRMFESFANDIGKDYNMKDADGNPLPITVGAHPKNPYTAEEASNRLKAVPVERRAAIKNIVKALETAKVIFAEEAKKARSDEKTLAVALKNIEQWLTDGQYKEYREVIIRLLDLAGTDKTIAKALYDSFWRQIPFGTGGRRWQVGVGPNRMNAFMAAMTFQGHYAYLMEQYKADLQNGGAVAAAWDVRAFNRFFAETPSLQKFRETIEAYCPALAHLSSEDLSKIGALVYAGNNVPYLHASEMRSTPWVSFLINNYVRIKSELEAKSASPATSAAEKARIDKLLAKLHEVKKVVAAIVDSSSHNPYDNNGTKFYEPSGAQSPPQIVQKLMDLGNAVEKINYFAEDTYYSEGLEAAFKKAVDSGKVIVLDPDDLSILDGFYIQNAIDEIKSLYTPEEWAAISPWFEKLLVSFNAINGTGVTGVLKALDKLRFGLASVKGGQKSGVLRSPGDVPTWEFTEGRGNIPNPEAEKTFNTAMQIGIVRTIDAVLRSDGELYGKTSITSLVDEDGSVLDISNLEAAYGKPFSSAVELLNHVKKTSSKFIRGVILKADDGNEGIVRAFSVLNSICLLTDPDADRVGLGMQKIERKGNAITVQWLSANDNDESGIVLFRYRLERLLHMARQGTIMSYLADRRAYVNSRRAEYGKPLQTGDEYEIVMVNTVVSNPLEKKIAEVIGKEISDLTGGKVKVVSATHHVGFKFTGEIIDIINKGEFDGITGEVLKESGVNLNNAIYGMSSEEGEGSLIGDKGSVDKDSVVTSLGLAVLAAEQLRDGKTMYDYLMETYEKYGYSKAYLEPMVMTGDYGFRMINQEIMRYLRNDVLKKVQAGQKVQWGNFILTKGKDHYDLIRPLMVKMGYGDDPVVWENTPEIKAKAQALIESVNILEFEVRLVSEVEARVPADKQTRIVVVLRPSGTEPKHKNFISVVDSQGLRSGEDLNGYIARINGLNRQIMDEVMIECYKASKAEYPSQVTEYRAKSIYKISDLTREDLAELLKVFPIVVSCEAKLGVYFPLRDFIIQKGNELAEIGDKAAYDRAYDENRAIVQKYLVSFEKNNGVQFVEESVMMNLKRQLSAIISSGALNDKSVRSIYSQAIMWFGKEVGKNRFTALMAEVGGFEQSAIDRYIAEFSSAQTVTASASTTRSAATDSGAQFANANIFTQAPVAAAPAANLPLSAFVIAPNIDDAQGIDKYLVEKIAKEVNAYLASYASAANKDEIKRIIKVTAHSALEIDDMEASRAMQIIAGQALAIMTLIDQKIPGVDKLQLTANDKEMIINGKGKSYISAQSALDSGIGIAATEGAAGIYWRGSEGISKLGNNIVKEAVYDQTKFDTQAPRMVMYTMLHIGGYHTTVFLHDYLPGSVQHTSTGPGHLQNDSMDIKYVVSGRGVQWSKSDSRIFAQKLVPGSWFIANPYNVDSVENLGGLIFNDFSFKVPGVTPQAATPAMPYHTFTIGDETVFMATATSAPAIEFHKHGEADRNRSIRELYDIGDNRDQYFARPRESGSTENPKMATPEDIALAAAEARGEPMRTEPKFNLGSKGYKWGEPATDSYILQQMGKTPAELGIDDSDQVAERILNTGSLPLTAKILTSDEEKALSLQLHPFGEMIEFLKFGKVYVLKKNVTADAYLEALTAGRVLDVMEAKEVKAGTVIMVPAYMPHAYDGEVRGYEVKGVTPAQDKAGTISFFDRLKFMNTPGIDIVGMSADQLRRLNPGRENKDVLTMSPADLDNVRSKLAIAEKSGMLKAVALKDITFTPAKIADGDNAAFELIGMTGSYVAGRYNLKAGGSIAIETMQQNLETPMYVLSGEVTVVNEAGDEFIYKKGEDFVLRKGKGPYRLVSMGGPAVVYTEYIPADNEKLVADSSEAFKREMARPDRRAFTMWVPQSMYNGDTLKGEISMMKQMSGELITLRPYTRIEDIPSMDKDMANSVVVALDTDLKNASSEMLASSRILPVKSDYVTKLKSSGRITGYVREVEVIGAILGNTKPEELSDKANMRAQDLINILRNRTVNKNIGIVEITALMGMGPGAIDARRKILMNDLPLIIPVDVNTDIDAAVKSRRQALWSA